MSKKWGILYIPLSCFLIKQYTTVNKGKSFDVYLNVESLKNFWIVKENDEVIYEVLSTIKKTKPDLVTWISRIDKQVLKYGNLTFFEMLEMDVNNDRKFIFEEFEVVEISNDIPLECGFEEFLIHYD